MPIEPGSLVLVNFTAKVKDTGELVETTIEEVAKEHNVHDPNRQYKPSLIAVGEGWVLKGVDEALLKADVPSKFTVEVPPEKGFGPRDPSKVRVIPLRRLGDRAGELRPGVEVEVGDQVGIVKFVGSGRAQIDFNHRLAGKTLVYELEVLKKLEATSERIAALIQRRLPLPDEELKFELKGEVLTIDIPKDWFLADGLQVIKRAIANDIFKYIEEVKRVSFIETYESPRPKAEKEEVKAERADEAEKKDEKKPSSSSK